MPIGNGSDALILIEANPASTAIAGTPFQDLILADANQEHGILKVRPGSNAVLPELAIGDRVRILPNHACATGAQHRSYHIVHGTSDIVTNEWVRFTGW